MNVVLIAIVFIVVLAVSFGVVAWLTRETQLEKAIHERVGAVQIARQEEKERQAAEERILKPSETGRVAWLDEFLSRYRFASQLKKLLLHAGSEWTPGTFVFLSIAAGLLAYAIAYFMFPAALLDALAGVGAVFVPYLYLKRKRSARLIAFNNGLPDAIDLMARALRAGHSLSSAIEVLSEQAIEPVAVEFHAVFRQQNFGLPLRDALLQMAERVPSKDLQFMVTAMLVQKETGGNLTEILDRTAYVIRDRIRIEGEVRVKTAQGRLTGWILSLLPVILLALLNMIDPGYSHVLLHDPMGQKLLYLGAGLIVIGTFAIRKIVNIEV